MESPGGFDNEPDQNELLERALEHHHKPKFTNDEFEALTRIGTEFTDIAEFDHRTLVLGSYHPDNRGRLEQLKGLINNFDESAVAYLLDDFLQKENVELPALLKFKLIAGYSHHIIFVCEHDRGGQLIEQGILIEAGNYLEYSHMIKRKYEASVEERKYSWMQRHGTFDVFDYRGHLHEWGGENEFLETSVGVLEDMMGKD